MLSEKIKAERVVSVDAAVRQALGLEAHVECLDCPARRYIGFAEHERCVEDETNLQIIIEPPIAPPSCVMSQSLSSCTESPGHSERLSRD